MGGGGGGWVEIIRIKAVLSSTRLELELELSLAIIHTVETIQKLSKIRLSQRFESGEVIEQPCGAQAGIWRQGLTTNHDTEGYHFLFYPKLKIQIFCLSYMCQECTC